MGVSLGVMMVVLACVGLYRHRRQRLLMLCSLELACLGVEHMLVFWGAQHGFAALYVWVFALMVLSAVPLILGLMLLWGANERLRSTDHAQLTQMSDAS